VGGDLSDPVEVFTADGLYLVCRGPKCRVVDPARGRTGGPKLKGSVLAHLHTSEPWAPVPEADWPDPVRRAAAEGWGD
jgi:hypothetical protein